MLLALTHKAPEGRDGRVAVAHVCPLARCRELQNEFDLIGADRDELS